MQRLLRELLQRAVPPICTVDRALRLHQVPLLSHIFIFQADAPGIAALDGDERNVLLLH